MTQLIGNDEKRRGWFVDLYNQWSAGHGLQWNAITGLPHSSSEQQHGQ